MTNLRVLIAAAIFAAVAVIGPYARAEDKSIVVASTTSTEDSGLFGNLLPKFQEKTGITVKVVAQGTGQRSTPPGVAMPTLCSCMPRRRKQNSWTKVTV
jgi:ABC-type tungstate transport system permease subunit